MSALRISAAVLVVLLADYSMASAVTVERNDAQIALAALDRNLAAGRIQRIEILAVPNPMSVEVAMTEDDLPTEAFYRCETRAGQSDYSDIVQSVRNTHVTGEQDDPDIRWGMMFFDNKGYRVSTIYTSANMPTVPYLNAKIDGHVATIDKPIIEWLVNHVPSAHCTKLRP